MSELLMDYGAWQPNTLRISVFPMSSSPVRGQSGLWKRAMRQEPDSIDFRPKDKLTTEQGVIGDIHLRVAIRDERIDWFLQSQPNLLDGGQPKTVPVMHDLEAASKIVRDVAIASAQVSLQRLAFSVALVEIIPSLDSALRRLSEHLPELRLDNVGSDFVYQVNRRRRSQTVPQSEINRIAKWSVLQGGSVNLVVSPSAKAVVDASEVLYGARLDLDINNVPARSAISGKKLPILLEELTTIASEIALKGDVN